MSKILKRYFLMQRFIFSGLGLDIAATPEKMVKRPILMMTPLVMSILLCIANGHYVLDNASDYLEATDSLTLLCQSLISVWKVIMVIWKRKDFANMIARIERLNVRAAGEELKIVRKENTRDIIFSTTYFILVLLTGAWSLLVPIYFAVHVYVTTGEVDLPVPHKATYFWNHEHVKGYSLVYIWDVFIIYFIACSAVSTESMFSWLVCNIIAQFRILMHRLELASQFVATTQPLNVNHHVDDDDDNPEMGELDPHGTMVDAIIACVKFHRRTLRLTQELNSLYGAIIFVKFIVSGTQICCLAFHLVRGNNSLFNVAYLLMFLSAAALQLILYCYNGQRLKDESLLVTTKIYSVFPWSKMPVSTQRMLVVPMARAQQFSELRGVFFTVDLSLYLWVFRTAGSLIAALKTLEEKEE
ncbi:odorant receptor 45a-like [Musca autumnalis]|uniref:odorant receptor 45a-like n=1 Tax=Musca autumnalis TaxID=221902 RepID=UPI003CF204D7